MITGFPRFGHVCEQLLTNGFRGFSGWSAGGGGSTYDMVQFVCNLNRKIQKYCVFVRISQYFCFGRETEMRTYDLTS